MPIQPRYDTQRCESTKKDLKQHATGAGVEIREDWGLDGEQANRHEYWEYESWHLFGVIGRQGSER